MASMVTSRIAKHILKENAKNHFGSEDPYFDYTPSSSSGRGGKLKKTRKPAPPGLTTAEQKILKKVTRRAYRLDNCFNICGVKVGWGAIIGIIPGLGDVFDILMALMVYRTICQVDIPQALRARMLFNIMLDFGIGLVPILGDVADAVFRANTRNAALLYGYLKAKGADRIKGEGNMAEHGHGNELVEKPKPIAAPTSAPATHASATRTQHVHEPTPGIETQQTTGTVAVDHSHDHEIAPVHGEKTKAGGKGGWFDRLTGGSKAPPPAKEPDLEAGERV